MSKRYAIATFHEGTAAVRAWFDGFGFCLLAAGRRTYDMAEAINVRSLICHEWPDCRIVEVA